MDLEILYLVSRLEVTDSVKEWVFWSMIEEINEEIKKRPAFESFGRSIINKRDRDRKGLSDEAWKVIRYISNKKFYREIMSGRLGPYPGVNCGR